jgi:hypothetical protein
MIAAIHFFMNVLLSGCVARIVPGWGIPPGSFKVPPRGPNRNTFSFAVFSFAGIDRAADLTFFTSFHFF